MLTFTQTSRPPAPMQQNSPQPVDPLPGLVDELDPVKWDTHPSIGLADPREGLGERVSQAEEIRTRAGELPSERRLAFDAADDAVAGMLRVAIEATAAVITALTN